jgi:5,6,7,8-tetrahydromethanopterin hydro-lyase
MLIGEGFEGSGTSAAHVNVVLGDRLGPVGVAWTTALATPSAGHAPFTVTARPGLPVKPLALFVNRSTITNEDHATVTLGAAHSGIAAGIVEAVRTGIIPVDVADNALLICSVWVDPAATMAHADVIFVNNRTAVMNALAAAGHDFPSAAEVVSDTGGIWNPYFNS